MPKPIALTKGRTVDYVLLDNRDDPVEDQVTFKLRTLPFNARMDVFDAMAMDAAGGSVNPGVGKRYKVACTLGIAGWSENFEDAEGKAIVWQSRKKQYGMEVIDEALLDVIPDDVISEVGNEINKLSTSDAHEVGK